MQIVGFIICKSRTIPRYRNENNPLRYFRIPLYTLICVLCYGEYGGKGSPLLGSQYSSRLDGKTWNGSPTVRLILPNVGSKSKENQFSTRNLHWNCRMDDRIIHVNRENKRISPKQETGRTQPMTKEQARNWFMASNFWWFQFTIACCQ